MLSLPCTRTLAGLAAIFVAVAAAPREVSASEGKFLPVAPDTLFGFLPKEPPGWKMTESVAETRHSLWLLSTAKRSFEKLPDTQDGENPGALPSVTISVMDTGGCTPYFAVFENFVPGEDGKSEKIEIDSYPAIVTRGDSGRTTVKMLVKKRFLVEYRIEHQDLKELKPWLEACDFGGLSRIPTPAGIGELPPIITIVRVDELHPERNTKYPMHLTSKADELPIPETDAEDSLPPAPATP